MNYLAVDLYKRIELTLLHHTDLVVVGHLCACVRAAPAGVNSWCGRVVLPAPVLSLKCELFLDFSCVFHTACVCDHFTFSGVTTAHLRVAGTRQLACVLSHIGL